MNIIVSNLIANIKEKGPDEWTSDQLEDFAFAIQYIYKYSADAEDKAILHSVYNRIVGVVNTGRSYTRINPSYLSMVDKVSR